MNHPIYSQDVIDAVQELIDAAKARGITVRELIEQIKEKQENTIRPNLDDGQPFASAEGYWHCSWCDSWYKPKDRNFRCPSCQRANRSLD